jgi:nitrite reductase (NADH) large subunit
MSVTRSEAWICTVCGYIHYGPEPPEYCPVCGSTSDLFEPYVENVPEPAASLPARWRCLNCGYIHEGPEPPATCPVCGAPAERFEPYAEEGAAVGAAGIEQRVVIVGAGIAGVSAAEALRKASSRAEIVLLSKEPYLPYYRLNLTRYLAGQVEADLLDLHPASWYEERDIQLELEAELSTIDVEGRRLTLSDGAQHSYDKLILTVGSHPFVPPFPGANRENVTALRTRAHADAILAGCQDGLRCVCIGGGLLGLETAGALAGHGVDVTLLEGHGWLLPRQLNQTAGEQIESYVTSLGISIRKHARAEELVGDERVRGVLLKDGSTLPADLVVIATGVRSNSYLGRMIGLDVNRGIIVDNTLRTSHPDIYAAGDVAEHRGVNYGTWAPSQFQGTIAGMSVAGERAEFAGIPRSNMLKVLGVDMFSIGQIKPEDASYEVIEEQVDGAYYYFVFRDSHMVSAILLGETALAATIKEIVEKGHDCAPVLKGRPTAKDVLTFAEAI